MTDDAINTLANLNLNDPRAAEIMAKICVPHADGPSGRQVGVVPPHAVKYPSSKGKKPISADEAITRYRAKVRSGESAYPVESPDAKIGGSSPDDLDPFTTAEPVKKDLDEQEEPEEPVKKKRKQKDQSDVLSSKLLDALVAKLASSVDSEGRNVAEPPTPAETRTSALDEFKKRREVVRMKLSTGQVTMPCLCVQQEAYSITVFMDADASGFVFVPESGTEVSLSWPGSSGYVKAYFPGAQFTIPGLGVTGMVFLSDPDAAAADHDSKKSEERPAASSAAVKEVPKDPVFKYNPESGFAEDEFGLTKV